MAECLLEDTKKELKAASGGDKGFLNILGNIKTCKGKKGTRAPSLYNLHMKDCLIPLKGKGNHKENFKNCVSKWKTKKK